MESTDNIILHSFTGTCLHQWDMLMCGCMKNNFGPVFSKNSHDPLLIPYRTDQHDQIQLWISELKLHLQFIGVVFINIKNDQLFWMISGNLSAQFAADGATAAGDQYPAMGDACHHAGGFRMNRLSVK